MIKRFLTDTGGATAIEYAMIAVSIAVAAVTALGQVGDGVVAIYSHMAANFE